MRRGDSIGIKGLLKPEVDSGALDDAGKDVEEAMEEIDDLRPDVDVSGVKDKLDEVEIGGMNLGESVDGLAERLGVGGPEPAFTRVSGAGAGGPGAGEGFLSGLATSGGMMKVALGGAVALGMASALGSVARRLEQASPALQQTNELFGSAMNMFFRPFGRFLSTLLRPMAMGLLMFSRDWVELTQEEGLSVAIASEAGFDVGEGGATGTERAGARAGGVFGLGVGAVGGAAAGAKAGGLLGTLVGGPIGAAVGGTGGAIAGGVVGALGGTAVGSRLGAEAGRVADAFIEKANAISWARYIPEVRWGSLMNWTGWAEFIGRVAWGEYVSELKWVSWIDEVSWDIWLDPLVWGGFLDQLSWGSWVDPLSWDFISEPPWTRLITGVDLGEYVKGAIGVGGGSGSGGDGGSGWFPFASGGVVTGPTRALIGEAGPEAVIPLSKLGDALSDTGGGDRSGDRRARESVDLSPLESKMDDVVSELRRSSGDVVVKLGERELLRAVQGAEDKYDSGRVVK